MKEKIYPFDVLCLFVVLALLFTLGFHIGLGEKADTVCEATVTVSLVKSKTGKSTEGVMIDGKYGCTVLGLDGVTLTFVCEGEMREAGFLTSGAKYLSENQPIEIIGGENYFFGRISSIKTATGN